jgi:hypothetical protein
MPGCGVPQVRQDANPAGRGAEQDKQTDGGWVPGLVDMFPRSSDSQNLAEVDTDGKIAFGSGLPRE